MKRQKTKMERKPYEMPRSYKKIQEVTKAVGTASVTLLGILFALLVIYTIFTLIESEKELKEERTIVVAEELGFDVDDVALHNIIGFNPNKYRVKTPDGEYEVEFVTKTEKTVEMEITKE